MSEKEVAVEGVETAKPKKKGKLPVLIALAALLGGGGFFAMKMRGGGAKEATSLGEILPLEQEFLSNLKDPETYVRAKVALHLEKGFDKAKVAEKMPAIEDAIYMIFSNRSLAQVRSNEGKLALKADMAKSINALFGPHGAKTAKGPESKGSESEEKSVADAGKRKHPEWESDTGPVLKVYFQSFATQ